MISIGQVKILIGWTWRIDIEQYHTSGDRRDALHRQRTQTTGKSNSAEAVSSKTRVYTAVDIERVYPGLLNQAQKLFGSPPRRALTVWKELNGSRSA